jgi:hypothetical protein
MPITSPGYMPAGTIRDLGLPPRAVTALTRAGVTRIDDLAVLTGRDLTAISGLGPGMIAAIRLVVPEPSTSDRGSVALPTADHEQLRFPATGPEPEPAEEESPTAPAIPSFDSLRAPRRRTAMDVLMPGPPPVPPPVPPSTPRAPAGAPRPAEYADLVRLGLVVVRAMTDLSWRVARWSVRQPVDCLRRVVR